MQKRMAEQGRKQKILIVEDDRPLAAGLCRALQNDNTETVSCHTLQEAEKLLEGFSFDLVVLDVNLPDGNGFDFLQQIKAKYDMCVIMLTANDMETDVVAGLEAGADDYITKPFSLAVLRARVETQLRRVARGRQPVKDTTDNTAGDMISDSTGNGGETRFTGEGWITDGEYQFHFAKMLFFHGEKQVELSKTEQRLLRMLVENKGITLAREQLLDFTWSVDAAFVDENTLSVAMKRLRDKLDAQERIKTVYGIGYRWE